MSIYTLWIAVMFCITCVMLAFASWYDRREDARFAARESKARLARALRARAATKTMRKRQPIPVVKPVAGYWIR